MPIPPPWATPRRASALLGRNKVWLLVKNYPNPWLVRNLPLITSHDALAVGYGLAARGPGRVKRTHGGLGRAAPLPGETPPHPVDLAGRG